MNPLTTNALSDEDRETIRVTLELQCEDLGLEYPPEYVVRSVERFYQLNGYIPHFTRLLDEPPNVETNNTEAQDNSNNSVIEAENPPEVPNARHIEELVAAFQQSLGISPNNGEPTEGEDDDGEEEEEEEEEEENGEEETAEASEERIDNVLRALGDIINSQRVRLMRAIGDGDSDQSIVFTVGSVNGVNPIGPVPVNALNPPMQDVVKVIEDINKVKLVFIKNDQTLKENTNPECLLCYDPFLTTDLVRVLPCNHCFHRLCIDKLLTTVSHLCPFCKHPAGEHKFIE